MNIRGLDMLRCPICNKVFEWVSSNVITETLEIRSYRCQTHGKFERHIFRSYIGLIVEDMLYSVGENGYLERKW